MKYYQLQCKLWGDDRKVYPIASGSTVTDNNLFDQAISRYKSIDKAPVFDYFSLVSISQPGLYDWILLDIYDLAEINSPIVNGFFISEKVKNLLNQFLIQPPFQFYESRLSYQGRKYVYYVFQLISRFNDNLDYPKCTWQYSPFFKKKDILMYDKKINSKVEYNDGNGLLLENKFKVFPEKAVFKQYYDLFYIHSVSRFAISERLKNAIEDAGITGFDITPIEHIDFEFEEGVPQ